MATNDGNHGAPAQLAEGCAKLFAQLAEFEHWMFEYRNSAEEALGDADSAPSQTAALRHQGRALRQLLSAVGTSHWAMRIIMEMEKVRTETLSAHVESLAESSSKE